MAFLTRACPLCDSSDNTFMREFSRDHWRIVSCDSCGFIYLQNAPDYQALHDDFDWSVTYEQERQKRRENRKLYYFASDSLKKIKNATTRRQRREIKLLRHYQCTGNLIDVGCASGATLKSLPAGLIPFGVEISSPLAKESNSFCESKGGFVIRADAASGLRQFDKDFADVITMISYLEHEISPLEVLKSAKTCLKKDGMILIKVPNFSCVNRKLRGLGWPGFRFPDHVNYFTPDTLQQMVLRAGLTIKSFSWLDRNPLSDNVWLLAGR